VNAGRQTRYRISGKKEHEAGDLEGQPVLHLGKLVLAPIADRVGSGRSARSCRRSPTFAATSCASSTEKASSRRNT
jgi:hypothetical protein